jgi:signal transduction histidine kinase
MAPRTPWPLAIAAALLVLLATLATMQYRWLGDVSEAERGRLRASARARATEFADDLDRVVTTIFETFHVAPDRFDHDPAGTLADAYRTAQQATPARAIIAAVYVADLPGGADWHLQKLDVDRPALQPADAPGELAFLRRPDPSTPLRTAARLVDTIDAAGPALIIGIPTFRTFANGSAFRALPDPSALLRLVVVVLDANVLQRQLVAPLAAKHFGSGDSAEYVVTIVRRGDPAHVVYSSDPSVRMDEHTADVTMPVLTLRTDDMKSLASEGAARAGGKDHLSITIVRRTEASYGTHVLAAGDTIGGWQLLIRGKAGSLDALVARSRRRNIAISLGVLGLLAASIVLIIASAQRQQRLARQQMEFVAAVSHELRTPLAVICSAGENLADGLVADREQVRTYGALVETEGRRLAAMVERVMEFAGLSSGAAIRPRAGVDVSTVVADAVHGVGGDARDRGVTVNVRAEGEVPTVDADADALRSAVQNVLGNAVKYSPNGGAVDIVTRARDGHVRISVTDRGVGIDAADLPHIFKPFYRGRRALDAQVRGSGVGLSVVRHIVDAHHGTIAVDSRVGEGTTVTIELQVRLFHERGQPEPAARSAEA